MGVIWLLFSCNPWLFPKIVSLLTSSHARAKQTLTQEGKHSTGLCAHSSLFPSPSSTHPSKNWNSFPFLSFSSLLPSLPLSLSSIQQLEFGNKMVITGIRNDTLNKKNGIRPLLIESRSGVADCFDKNGLHQLDSTADIFHKWMSYICSSKVLTKNVYLKAYSLKAFSKKRILTNVSWCYFNYLISVGVFWVKQVVSN